MPAGRAGCGARPGAPRPAGRAPSTYAAPSPAATSRCTSPTSTSASARWSVPSAHQTTPASCVGGADPCRAEALVVRRRPGARPAPSTSGPHRGHRGRGARPRSPGRQPLPAATTRATTARTRSYGRTSGGSVAASSRRAAVVSGVRCPSGGARTRSSSTSPAEASVGPVGLQRRERLGGDPLRLGGLRPSRTRQRTTVGPRAATYAAKSWSRTHPTSVRVSRRQGHRAVDRPVALEERHRRDPLVGELGPGLADPRLGVGLGDEALAGVLLGRLDLGAAGVLEPPPPRPLGGGRRAEGRRLLGRFTTHAPTGRRTGSLVDRKTSRRPRTSTLSSASALTNGGTSAMPMPLRSVGLKVPEVMSHSGHVGGQEDQHPGPRDAAAVGDQAAQQALRAGLLLGEQRVAAPEPLLLPPHRPAEPRLVGGDVDGDVLAVERVAHLGAQRVAGAETAGEHAVLLRPPPSAGPTARRPPRCAAISS